MEKPKEQRIFCDIVSPRNVRSYTHKFSPTLLPKHELNKGTNNRHARVDGVKTTRSQPYTKDWTSPTSLITLKSSTLHVETVYCGTDSRLVALGKSQLMEVACLVSVESTHINKCPQ